MIDWNQIWQNIVNFFTDNFWNIVLFFATLLIGIIVVKLVLNISRRMMKKSKLENVTQSFIYHIIKFCLYLILILILLNIIGIAMTGVLTAISALLLAIGMALQNIITNIANGIVIVSMHMFKKGDYVSVSGVEGSIDDINFIYTTLITPDNKKITIPNSSILNNAVTNYGANKTRRVDWTFTVAYESDVELVKSTILEVIKSNGSVLLEPKAPFCRLKTLDASSINFFANCWVDSEDYWDVYYYVVENVFNEFKRKNISIPYNQLEIRERKDEVTMPVVGEKLPERVEKVRKQNKKTIDLENDNVFASIHQMNKQKWEESKQHRLDKKVKKQAKKSQNNVKEDVETTEEKVETSEETTNE